MVLFRVVVVFVVWTSSLQGGRRLYVFHDCLVVNGTSNFIINIPPRHGCARVLTSGHPLETITRVLTYGHSPGPLKHDIDLGIDDLQVFTAVAGNGNRGVSSG